jgi:hypothetical protein
MRQPQADAAAATGWTQLSGVAALIARGNRIGCPEDARVVALDPSLAGSGRLRWTASRLNWS